MLSKRKATFSAVGRHMGQQQHHKKVTVRANVLRFFAPATLLTGILTGLYALIYWKGFSPIQGVDIDLRNHFETDNHQLPIWIQNYVAWHHQMRAQFNGTRLFTDPDAPPLLIRTCLGLCGGLHDRLGQLPWDLYLANQTKRVLLLHWHRPVPLQHFLLPNQIDWTVPKGVEGFYPKRNRAVRVSRKEMEVVRSILDLFTGYDSERPEKIFWEKHVDEALERARSGSYKQIKVLRHRLLGHINEVELESRLRALGEDDMIHWTPSFGKVFWMFFRPSPAIQSQLQRVYRELNLEPGRFSAVHCRVRHPKATPLAVNVLGKHSDYPADKTGLPWEGETRTFAIKTATRALQCAKRLLKSPNESIYFFSDSNDLVRYMSHELSDPKFILGNTSVFHDSKADSDALEVSRRIRIVAREMSAENTHIDLQKGRDPPHYYGTFVDLLLAVAARCVTYGVGYYVLFASKISGTRCKLLYHEEVWGGTDSKRANTKQCEPMSLSL